MGFGVGEVLAIVGIASTVIGTGVSMMGQAQAADAQQRQAQYQAIIARNNEIAAENAAQDAIARAQVEEANKRNETDQVIGRQRVALAANGVLVDAGSALDITSDTAEIGEVDALTIRSNAEREALGFRRQGANFGSEAQLATLRGRAASDALPYQMGGTLLSNASSVARDWYRFNSKVT